MANGDKYKSKKQLKKEGLMEKGGGIPSRPSWKNRMHKLVDRFKAPAFVGTPPSSVDWVKDTVVPKRKRKAKSELKRTIKKVSKDADDSSKAVSTLSKNLELSKREINYYITSHNINIEKVKKTCQ